MTRETAAIEDLVRGLTKAQREWLTVRARRHPSGQVSAMPPSNTYGALRRLGLMEQSALLTPLGLQVRAALSTKDQPR